MSDSYVTSKATIKCSCGDKSARLTVYPDRTVFLTGMPMANVSDHVSLYNIAPFGKCHTTAYPPTGSATAANHGTLTPMPCVPGTVSEWRNGKSDYLVKGKPALLKSSYCRCQWGGIITIINDGQQDTGTPDMSKDVLESHNERIYLTGAAANIEEPITPQIFIENAIKYKGSSYSMNNRIGPNSFDCSGLVQVAAGLSTWTTSNKTEIEKKFDLVLFSDNKMLLKDSSEMNKFISQLQSGDVLIWDKKWGHKCYGGTGHTMIYINDGTTFEARGRNGVNYYNDLKKYWLIDENYGYPLVYRLKS